MDSNFIHQLGDKSYDLNNYLTWHIAVTRNVAEPVVLFVVVDKLCLWSEGGYVEIQLFVQNRDLKHR